MMVNWTEAALRDLQGIELYIARHSVQYARGMVDRIFARTGMLADQPRSGAMVPEYGEESLRELLEYPYRIVYRIVDENRIDVVAVVHAARQMPPRI